MLQDRADELALRLKKFAEYTLPFSSAVGSIQNYVSTRDGVGYEIAHCDIIAGMPSLGMGNFPVIVSWEIGTDDRIVVGDFRYITDKGYKLKIERIVEGTSGFQFTMAHGFEEGHFGIGLAYGWQAQPQAQRAFLSVGTNNESQTAKNERRILANLKASGAYVSTITPYQGLVILDHVANDVLNTDKGQLELEKIVRELNCHMN